MGLVATLTGTCPPVRFPPPQLSDDEVDQSIHDAVAMQQAAIEGLDVDWLFVSGQPRNDIVSLFARGCALEGEYLPYQITDKVQYNGPILLRDLKVAAQAVDGRPLKAHITGPTLIAESCDVIPGTLAYEQHYAPSSSEDPKPNLAQLTLDLARILAQETQALLETPDLRIKYLQIDEPTLAYGADLELASQAIGIISEVARARSIPVILHACGDVSDIMLDLLQMPVEILNLVDVYANAVPWLNADVLAEHDKKLALGCIPVDERELPSTRRLVRELTLALKRYGRENVWGLTPHCGLRQSSPELAHQRMNFLAQVTAEIHGRFNASLEA